MVPGSPPQCKYYATLWCWAGEGSYWHAKQEVVGIAWHWPWEHTSDSPVHVLWQVSALPIFKHRLPALQKFSDEQLSPNAWAATQTGMFFSVFTHACPGSQLVGPLQMEIVHGFLQPSLTHSRGAAQGQGSPTLDEASVLFPEPSAISAVFPSGSVPKKVSWPPSWVSTASPMQLANITVTMSTSINRFIDFIIFGLISWLIAIIVIDFINVYFHEGGLF